MRGVILAHGMQMNSFKENVMSRNIVKLLALLPIFVLVSASVASFAQGAMNGGGGADPKANEFLDIGWEVQRLLKNNKIPNLNEDSGRFAQELDRIQKSLDGQSPLLELPPGNLVDCFGVTKVGCVGEDRKIRVARDGWDGLQPAEKYETVSLEIFKLMAVKDRYPKARLVRDYVRQISTPPLVKCKLLKEREENPGFFSGLFGAPKDKYLLLSTADKTVRYVDEQGTAVGPVQHILSARPYREDPTQCRFSLIV